MKLTDGQKRTLDEEYPLLGTNLEAALNKPGANSDTVIRDTREKFTGRSDFAGREGDDAMWAGIALDQLPK